MLWLLAASLGLLSLVQIGDHFFGNDLAAQLDQLEQSIDELGEKIDLLEDQCQARQKNQSAE